MLEDGAVRSERCIGEPSFDIPPNWKDIRAKFGYKTLYDILLGDFALRNLFEERGSFHYYEY